MTGTEGDDALAHRRDYFDAQYQTDPDPWGFDTSPYERRKYDLTIAALDRPRYRRGVEPGCANGALTGRLAERCDELIAHDIVPAALERARRRLGGHDQVELVEASFPRFWPAGTGDLVVWSEVAYYLTDDGLDVALGGLERWLEPGGTLVAVHWTGPTDYPRPGASVLPWLDASGLVDRRTTVIDTDFDLGVFIRC